MKGQAFFEFIIFLPLFLILYLVMIILSGAINGSINQQKATRGYFYYLAKNNSYIPSQTDLKAISASGIEQSVGMQILGWANELSGGDGTSGSPVATCYKAGGSLLFKDNTAECKAKTPGRQSSFIKPLTVYGLCSMNYRMVNNSFVQDDLPAGHIVYNCRNL